VQHVDVIGAGGVGVALGGALAKAGWKVTTVDINEAKLEAGRRVGIEVNGIKERNLRFALFAEWTPPDRTILLLYLTGQMPMATVTGVKLTRHDMHFEATASQKHLGLKAWTAEESARDAITWFRQKGLLT
jgi:NAD(P)-dependent dehydrogenase (short-subunit alcohol dehydrogenase family)